MALKAKQEVHKAVLLHISQFQAKFKQIDNSFTYHPTHLPWQPLVELETGFKLLSTPSPATISNHETTRSGVLGMYITNESVNRTSNPVLLV